MLTGLSKSLQDIKDSRKTAVNDELKILIVDIATLQETRLADSEYPEGEGLHILLVGEALQRAQRAWSRICSEEQLAENG